MINPWSDYEIGKQIDVYDLKVGDFFIEDCYLEVWKVIDTNCREADMPYPFVLAKCGGEHSTWGYTNSSYAPVLYLMHKKGEKEEYEK